MLDELNSRLRELEGPARRQSTWHGSTPSVSSTTGGSLSYGGSPLASGQSMYQTSSPPLQHTPGSVHASMHQVSPPVQHYLEQPPVYQTTPPLAHGQGASYGQQHQQYQQQQPQSYFQQPVYSFNNGAPMATQPQQSAAQQARVNPASQFANWGGYGGPGGNPDTLDEENAVPPTSHNPWNLDTRG